jgi:hypothetical protein
VASRNNTANIHDSNHLHKSLVTMEPTDTSRDRQSNLRCSWLFDAPGSSMLLAFASLASFFTSVPLKAGLSTTVFFSGRVYSIRQIKALFRSPSSEAENLEEQLQSQLDLAWTSGS